MLLGLAEMKTAKLVEEKRYFWIHLAIKLKCDFYGKKYTRKGFFHLKLKKAPSDNERYIG
jgi:hypothetical protein